MPIWIKSRNNFDLVTLTASKEPYGGKTADLQEDPHHGEPVRLFGGLAKAGVFGVPVHQMELRQTNKQTNVN